MKKFKYVVGGLDRWDVDKQQEVLNKMGEKGMELVSVVSRVDGYFIFYFKKELINENGVQEKIKNDEKISPILTQEQ